MNCQITSCKGKEDCLQHCPCDCHGTSERIWNDAIAASYTSKVRSILIRLCDGLGYDDSPKHRESFDKAFGDLMKLFTSI